MAAVSYTLYRLIVVWWPLLTVAAALALVAGALLARAVRLARRRAAEHARWVEITPPASLPRDGAPAWWRAVAGIVHRAARRGISPRHLAVEFVADERGVRAGVWVPPGLPVQRVAEQVGRIWPGSRARVADPPRWTATSTADSAGIAGRVTAAEVHPTGGAWVPLAEPTARAARPADVGTDDVLRGLFSALADCGPGERCSVQLIVTPAHGTTRSGAADQAWWVRALVGGLRLAGRLVLGVLDLFLSSHHTSNAPSVRTAQADPDPVIEAQRRAVNAKKAHGPHLLVTIRVVHHTTRRAADHVAGSSRQRRRSANGAAGRPAATGQAAVPVRCDHHGIGRAVAPSGRTESVRHGRRAGPRPATLPRSAHHPPTRRPAAGRTVRPAAAR